MEDFDAWWLVDKGRSKTTLAETKRKLDAMQRAGLDLAVVLSEPGASHEHGRAFLLEQARAGVPSNTRRDYGKALNRLRAWLQEREYERWRLLPRWPLAREVVAERPRFSDAQLRAMRAYRCRDPYVQRRRAAMLYVAEMTGLRVSEIASLRLRDVDVTGRRLWVGSPAKNGPRRAVPLPDLLDGSRLMRWLAVRHEPAKGDGL